MQRSITNYVVLKANNLWQSQLHIFIFIYLEMSTVLLSIIKYIYSMQILMFSFGSNSINTAVYFSFPLFLKLC